MTKNFILVFLLVIKTQSYSQIPDTFPRTIGAKEVKVFFTNFKWEDKNESRFYTSYQFNNEGYCISKKQLDPHKKKTYTCEKYFYNNDGTIDYRQYFGVNYSIGKKDYWDSTQLNREIKYEYIDGQPIIIRWFDDTSKTLSEEIIYHYNNKNLVEYESFVSYNIIPIEDTSVAPDTAIIKQGRRSLKYRIMRAMTYDTSTTIRYKSYTYSGDSIYVEYFYKDIPTGKEIILKNKEDKIIKKDRTSLPIIKYNKYTEENTYNISGLLIRTKINNPGIDGFGSKHDFSAVDETIYEYNSIGRLISKKIYMKGELQLEYNYTYL